MAGGGPRPGSVLFACSMNAVRSPMAAALCRHFFPSGLYARSAGVHRGETDAFAIAAMAELGLDITGHKPRLFEELEDDYFDLVITLAPEAHHKALEMTRTMAIEVEYWPTADPTIATGSRDQIMDAYRGVRDGLAERVRARFAG